MTLVQDGTNPLVWNVVDFDLPATDVAIGSKLSFVRPPTAGPFGTWTSSDPNGFPDFATVTISMTGLLSTTGRLSGLFPATDTVTLAGTVVPGYYHNVIQLTGSFAGPAGRFALAVHEERLLPARRALGDDRPVRRVERDADQRRGPSTLEGGLTLERGIANPNVYTVLNVGFGVLATPPVAISMPAAPNAGTLTFNPATRSLTGTLNVLVDGLPMTIPVDGIGESFAGGVMHPTALVIDDQALLGGLSSIHLEMSSTELVPPSPLQNDFQIGVTTSLLMRGRAGQIYATPASFSALPGINTPVGDIPVMPDDLLFLSVDPLNPFFLATLGVMPNAGEILVSVALPFEPALIGATFFMGGCTLDLGTLQVLAASNSHRCTVK